MLRRFALILASILCLAGSLVAQEGSPAEPALCPCPPPPPPPPIWTGGIAAGLSITSGNSDNESANLAVTAKRDAGGRQVWRFEALYLRGKNDGELTVDKLSASARDDVKLRGRLGAFGELRFLRDPFQELDSSLAPTVGLAWKAIAGERVQLLIDAGVGYIREEFTGGRTDSSATYRVGESLAWKLSPSADLTHSAIATFKADDADDYLIHAELAFAASVTDRTKLKVAFVDDYRNLPASPGLERNDLSTIAAVVFSF